ncbi:bacillithiol biosynthesis cysteine-adding enzyme BshC [Flavihumibacter petaseus]|uniref:Putative cysteine ligase BshC n=1 Tax=Flavihumibacter petaseus NBRC 106054 TaxID=1220578 RepID=A0A0E9N3U8_9BACT|nr:bacillithiol biosynthesis cysteine-adding enzyme BshC [Flavihumibacter petaseus]GAO44453.1 hypothetical protein FPE01S_03_04900 [Flavihumibacter petaseus NBRC 106054]
MEENCRCYPYEETGYFSTIVTDYVRETATIRPFYEHSVDHDGFAAAIRQREQFPTDRKTLVTALEKQYAQASLQGVSQVEENIKSLLSPDTFTICTAHQPNIFTGYLYFVYKVLHAVKLAEQLKKDFPGKHFVPVYYMGSEDADLDELGKVFLNGEKLVWDTKQTGAVGRMKTTGIEKLLNRISGELSVLPYGPELMSMLTTAYVGAPDIQTATFRLLHQLFAGYGLVVLIADEASLKNTMQQVFHDDLFEQLPSSLVTATNDRLAAHYKVQAHPREINLFYLEGNIRNRIVRNGDEFHVIDTAIRFSSAEMETLLKEHPERLSPNVILRGLYQETILPNIAFIGGGGELAYWLQLRDLFQHYKVPYPVQVLRNSFLLINSRSQALMQKLEIDEGEIFKPEQQLLNELVKRDTAVQIHLTNEIRDANAFYAHVSGISGKVDQSLVPHVEALQKRMIQQLANLEKKLLRAEKRKFSDQSRQLHQLKDMLFPRENLQERVENFMPFYARYGHKFIDHIYENSLTTEMKFIVCGLPVSVQLSN